MNTYRQHPDNAKILIHKGKSVVQACHKNKSGNWKCLLCDKMVSEGGLHVFVTGAEANRIAQENRQRPKIK